MLSTKLGKLRLRNPTVLAAGILGTSAELMKRVSENGAAAVTTKSVSLDPMRGYENPTVIEIETGLLNAIGLANPGIKEFKKELIKFKNFSLDTLLIGSCFGKIHEFPKVAAEMEEYSDAIEIDVSCPHVDDSIAKNPELLKNLVKDVKSIIKKPLIVKLSPNVTDIKECAKAAVDGGCDIISAVNTLRGMKIDINFGKPILSNKLGGYSGKGIKPIAVAKVYEISNSVDVPIIGIGGVTTGEDAVEMIMAGASAVGVGSGVYYRGIEVFSKINIEIKEFMKKNNYKNIEDMIGLAKNRKTEK